jgi:hypothetical protein
LDVTRIKLHQTPWAGSGKESVTSGGSVFGFVSACDLFSFLTLHALVLPLPPQSDAAEVQMRHSPLAGDASAPCRREIRLLESTARTGPVTAAGNKPEASSIELLISTAAARMAGWGIRNRKCRHETGLTRGKAELKSSTAPLPSPRPGYPQRSQPRQPRRSYIHAVSRPPISISTI